MRIAIRNVLTVMVACLALLAIGAVLPPPATCQDDGEDQTDCEVEKITEEDGKICFHDIDCGEGATSEKLCVNIPKPFN